jgi:hypothetical protein
LLTLIVAIAISLGAIALSLVRLRRVASALQFEPREFGKDLARGASSERLLRARDFAATRGPSWEAEFFDDLARAQSERERVALANEHLGDLDARLRWGARIPETAARVSVAASFCAAFFRLAAGRLDWISVLPFFVSAGIGFVGASWVGRAADRAAQRIRHEMDALVAHTLTASRGSSGGEN